MLIQLEDALSGTGTVHKEVSLESDHFRMADGISYAFRIMKPMDFTIIYQGDQKVTVKTEADVIGTAPCSRCLKEVEFPLSFSIEREIDFKETEQQRREELNEMSFLHEFVLDTEELFHEELMLHFPAQVLCKEDCRGLCPQCGIDLNEGSCQCGDAPKDPRMAAIQELFKQSILENSK